MEEESTDRYSPFFLNDHPNECTSTRHDDPMDVDSQHSDEYCDMLWSPITTQSTLNNWQMLTQSLTQDDDEIDMSSHSEHSQTKVPTFNDQQNTTTEALVVQNGEVGAPSIRRMTPSPDMFAESQVSSQDTQSMHSTEVATADLLKSAVFIQQVSGNILLKSSTTEMEDLTTSSYINTIPETPQFISEALITKYELTDKLAADPPAAIATIQAHTSTLMHACEDVFLQTIPETTTTATVLLSDINSAQVGSVPETPEATKGMTSLSLSGLEEHFPHDTVPETQTPARHSHTKIDAAPMAPPAQSAGHRDVQEDKLNTEEVDYVDTGNNDSTFCSEIERCHQQAAPQDTVPETQTPARNSHTEIDAAPIAPPAQSAVHRDVQEDKLNTKEVNYVNTGNIDSTFCSEIERCHQQAAPQVQSPDDEETYCSILERKTQPETFCPIVEWNLPKKLTAIDLDPTFCSLIEVELQESRQLETEAFDFEEAIMRIMHVAELKPSSQKCASGRAESQESGTFEMSPSGNATDFERAQSRRIKQQRIEQIILRFLQDLTGSGYAYLDVQRLGWSSCNFDPCSQTIMLSQDCNRRKVKTRHKIILILHLLDIVYHMLGSSMLCTKRELYYNDPELTQDVVKISTALRDISCMLDTQPWQLGVLSTPKGLVAGSLRIVLINGEIINLQNTHRGFILPQLLTNVLHISSAARLVLVVEKDTVFNKLLLANIIGRFKNRCILLTGKGYPDINTRYLLSQLWLHLRLPTYVLCDADAHGIQIMLTYRFGSISLPMCTKELAVPRCKWLGIRPTELTRLGVTTLPLTAADTRLLRTMSRRPYVDEALRRELQWLETNGRKAEIEALEQVAEGYLLNGYLAKRLSEFM